MRLPRWGSNLRGLWPYNKRDLSLSFFSPSPPTTLLSSFPRPSPPPPHCEDTVRRWPSQVRERVLTRNQALPNLDLELPAPSGIR